jgi:ankyrin repeat protein
MDQPTNLHPIIAQFKPVEGQWELNDANIKRIDLKPNETILHNYCQYINSTPLEVFRYLFETYGLGASPVGKRDKRNKTNYNLFRRALHCFESGCDVNILIYLLDKTIADVNYADNQMLTLLHLSCIRSNRLPIEFVKYLIQTKGADINAQDLFGYTPLHYTLLGFKSDNTNVKLLTYLLGEIGDVNIKSLAGTTILHLACQNISTVPLNIFKLLIETHRADVNIQDAIENTPLHYALANFKSNESGDIYLTTLTYLLNQDTIDVNLPTEGGRTLFHLVCNHINFLPLDLFKRFIEVKGGDINLMDHNNNTPLQTAILEFKFKCGDVKRLNYLLQQYGGINHKGHLGRTILHHACKEINSLLIDMFKYLIEDLGADVNVFDDSNETPIQTALGQFRPELCDVSTLTYLLGQSSVDINFQYRNGRTLFHLACEKINILPFEVFQFLIETKAGDVNIKDDNGDTPVHLAFYRFPLNNHCHLSTLFYLLDYVDINTYYEGRNGHTFLHSACARDGFDEHHIVEYLIQNVSRNLFDEEDM